MSVGSRCARGRGVELWNTGAELSLQPLGRLNPQKNNTRVSQCSILPCFQKAKPDYQAPGHRILDMSRKVDQLPMPAEARKMKVIVASPSRYEGNDSPILATN